MMSIADADKTTTDGKRVSHQPPNVRLKFDEMSASNMGLAGRSSLFGAYQGNLSRRPLSHDLCSRTDKCNDNLSLNSCKKFESDCANPQNTVNAAAINMRGIGTCVNNPPISATQSFADTPPPEPTVMDSSLLRGKESIQQLKKSLTLDFASPDSLKKSLATPEILSVLRFTSPDLEKFLTQKVTTIGNTPTPTQIFYPSNVTTEQEQYAHGFIDALNQLHALRGTCLPALLSPGFVAATIQQQQQESNKEDIVWSHSRSNETLSMEQLLRTLTGGSGSVVWTPTATLAQSSDVFSSPVPSTPSFPSADQSTISLAQCKNERSTVTISATSSLGMTHNAPFTIFSLSTSSSTMPLPSTTMTSSFPRDFAPVSAPLTGQTAATVTSTAVPNEPLPSATIARQTTATGKSDGDDMDSSDVGLFGAKRHIKSEAPDTLGEEVVIRATPEVTMGPTAAYFVTLSSAGRAASPPLFPSVYRRKKMRPADVDKVAVGPTIQSSTTFSRPFPGVNCNADSFRDVSRATNLAVNALTTSSASRLPCETVASSVRPVVVGPQNVSAVKLSTPATSSPLSSPPPSSTASSSDVSTTTSASASPQINYLPSTSSGVMDPRVQERLKLERKRARNRLAASRCRRRKLDVIATLSDKVDALTRRNDALEAKVRDCRTDVQRLKKRVEEHRAYGCKV